MNPQSVFALQQIFLASLLNVLYVRLSNSAFQQYPYKRMCLTNKVNLTKRFSEKYKCMCLITRLNGIWSYLLVMHRY